MLNANVNNLNDEVQITEQNIRFYELLCDTQKRKEEFKKILAKEKNEYYSLEKYRTIRFLRKDIDIVHYEDFKRVIFERDITKVEKLLSRMFLEDLTIENLKNLSLITNSNGWDLKSFYEAYIGNTTGKRLASILNCRNK